MYADDVAITAQATTLNKASVTVQDTIKKFERYFYNWGLKPNPKKTVSCCFHLNNQQAHESVSLNFCGEPIKHDSNPVYLGVTLDRALTYKAHLQKVKKKVSSRCNLLRKLAATTWGCKADTLRTSTLALVHSAAEYCAPVWAGSHHTDLVDVEVNSALRNISGTVRPTNTKWLPVICNIFPSDLRRELIIRKEHDKISNMQHLPITQDLEAIHSDIRLSSRRPFALQAQQLLQDQRTLAEKWRDQWISADLPNRHLVSDPTARLPGFNLPRKCWTQINRFRTSQGRCAELMHKWGFSDDPSCLCGQIQSMSHISNDCPLFAVPGGIDKVHQADSDVVAWLEGLPFTL